MTTPDDIEPILSKLTPRQRELFRFLHAHCRIEFMTSEEIARRWDRGSDVNVRDIAQSIKRRLVEMDSQYRIQSKQVPGGGYLLSLDESRL